MKKNLKVVFVVMFLMVLVFSTHSFAEAETTYDLDLKLSQENVTAGDEFTVILTLKEGSSTIGGMSAKVNYDSSKFTLTKKECLKDGVIFSVDNDPSFSLVLNSYTNGDLLKLTFVTQNDVNVSTNNEIKLSNIKLVGEGYAGIEKEDLSVAVNIVDKQSSGNDGSDILSGIKIATPPTKTEYIAGEKFDPTGVVIKAIYSTEEEKIIENYTFSPNEELTTKDTVITFYYTENEITKAITQPITVKANGESGNDSEELKGITLDISNLTLNLNIKSKKILTAYPSPSKAKLPEIVWSSSNDGIAKLEETGSNGSVTVVPVSVGNAVITATTKDGKYSATCNVTVNLNGDVSGDNNNTTPTDSNTPTDSSNVDDTTAKSILPKTGAKTYILMIIIGLTGIGMVFYKRYKKYKGID